MNADTYRILLADDETSVLHFTERLLAKQGWECVCAKTADSALERLQNDRFDVLLADYRMPGNENLQLVQETNRILPSLPVILMTAYPSLESAVTAHQLNVFDYLTKPFDTEYLVNRVRQAVQHKRVLEALRASEERFRLLFEQTPVGYFSLSEDGRIVEVNARWSEVFGYRSDEAAGREFRSLLSPASAHLFQQILPGFRESGAAHNVELGVVRGDGTEAPCTFDGRVMRDEAGRFLRAHCVLHDVSEHKHLEEARRKAEARLHEARKYESLGVLAGGIAHDFNNILQGILGNASLALMDMDLNPALTECLREIERAALHASHLTNQMLAYAGKGKFLLQSIHLSKFVKDMEHLLEVNRPANTVLRYTLAEDIPTIRADALQLRQLILNLVTNAYEALGKDRGEVTLAAGTEEYGAGSPPVTSFEDTLEEGLYVYVEVADNGCGMDQETISKIFDPFFSTKFTGRGLGLPAVQGIARGHKGAIRVTSEPGSGTTVRALFPVASQPSRPSAAPEQQETVSQAKAGTARTVLLVDDEKAVREVGRRMLQRLGYEVLTAENGHEAVVVFREHQQEVLCVILDLTMPDSNSAAVFEEIRRVGPDVPILISSGYSAARVEELFAGKNIAGFIQKPYLYPGLREKLRALSGPKKNGGH
jgi:two-component system, cell cycle sensor histidine kinase and response regulator CckA